MHKTMTYAQRLRQARDHAGISQSELGRQIGMTPQSVQYLEAEENAAQGSNKTAKIADVCGVRALWLESGEGGMLDGAGVPIPSSTGVARTFKGLRPDLQRAIGLIVEGLAAPQKDSGGRSFPPLSSADRERTPVPVRSRTRGRSGTA